MIVVVDRLVRNACVVGVRLVVIVVLVGACVVAVVFYLLPWLLSFLLLLFSL